MEHHPGSRIAPLESSADIHLDRVLAAMAGPEARPRDDQRGAVRAIVDDAARVLVVQATGWGKSAVYWAATSALRARGRGPTLIVSPLLALMRDQVAAACRAGLIAVTINSTNVDDWDETFRQISANEVDALLVSPERLGNPRFAAVVGDLVARAGLIVIDEAHCISDWGFDFRPDYQRLARTLTGLGANTPVLATTATANTRVTLDVAAQLGADTVTFRGSLARSSLRLGVVPGLSAIERYAWVSNALDATPGSGIVYTLTVAETDRLAGFLSSQGHAVAPYSGALEPAERERVEDQLRTNELKAVVATSALGMGYDKPDLAFCIHVGSPSSPVAYYQQVGRAGRALDEAIAVLLPAESDEQIWHYFATAGVPDEERVGAILNALADGPATLAALELATSIRRGRLEGLLKILLVDDILERAGTAWTLTGKAWVYDAERWQALAKVRSDEANLMRSFAAGAGCLMRFLQAALDDPDPADCGRCSVCTGALPVPGAAPSPEALDAARTYVRGRDVVIEPRKLWPSGSGFKGRIAGCSEGRALAFADDPGWSREIATLGNGPAPSDVLDGMVAVLGRWRASWGQRPVAIVAMPSANHHRLIGSVVDHLGRVGKLDVVHALTLSDVAPVGDVASAARVKALAASIQLVPGVSLPNGPVLLVDAMYRTGWSMTVAASLLRAQFGCDVMPLVVHQHP